MNPEDEFWEPPENEETHAGYVEPVNEIEIETTDATQQTEASTLDVIYEDLSGADPESTEQIVVVKVIESVGSDIIHADLFGSFLICGTLIGLALLRGIHGT